MSTLSQTGGSTGQHGRAVFAAWLCPRACCPFPLSLSIRRFGGFFMPINTHRGSSLRLRRAIDRGPSHTDTRAVLLRRRTSLLFVCPPPSPSFQVSTSGRVRVDAQLDPRWLDLGPSAECVSCPLCSPLVSPPFVGSSLSFYLCDTYTIHTFPRSGRA